MDSLAMIRQRRTSQILLDVLGVVHAGQGRGKGLPLLLAVCSRADKGNWHLESFASRGRSGKLVGFEPIAGLERCGEFSTLPQSRDCPSSFLGTRGTRKWEQVGLAPNPARRLLGQQIGSRGLAEQDGVVISQEIVRGGKLHLNRAVASHEVSRARHELAMQRQKVLTDVRIAFYETLIAQRQAELGRELVEIGERSKQTAERLMDAKEIAKLDLLQARITLEEDKIIAQNAHHRYSRLGAA